jgi:hypothetical protein
MKKKLNILKNNVSNFFQKIHSKKEKLKQKTEQELIEIEKIDDEKINDKKIAINLPKSDEKKEF